MGGPVRPSGYVGWGTTGLTNVAEPLDSKKQQGWGVNEQPPSSYFNWIQQKQDQWIQYLDWKTQLDNLIADDFFYAHNYNTNGTTGWLGSTNYPQWEYWLEGSGGGVGPVVSNSQNEAPAIGVFATQAQSQQGARLGQARITARVGNLYGRDFRMDALIRQIGWGATSSSAEIGFFDASGVATGNNIMMGFEWTGASGVMSAAWTPSGAASPTSVSLGIAPSGWQKLSIESRSPTMSFYVNDLCLASAQSVAFGASGIVKTFGVRCISQTGPTGVSILIDRLDLKIRRNPT
jgi:hypothetical protein